MDQGKAANGDGGGKGNVSSALGPQWHHLCVVRGQMHCNPGHLASNRCSPPPSSSNHMSLAELQSCWFGNWQVSLFVGHSPGSVKIRIAYKLISVLKEK